MGLVSLNDAGLLERDVQVPGRIKNMEESIYSTIDVIFTAQNLDRQQFLCWVISLGRGARITGPEDVVQKVKEIGKRLLEE